MKALILNSGLGSRMGVLTSEHPKCMTEITARDVIRSARYELLKKHDTMIDVIYYNHYSCWQVNRLKETIKRAEYHFR